MGGLTERRAEEAETAGSLVATWKENVLGRGDSKSKGPEKGHAWGFCHMHKTARVGAGVSKGEGKKMRVGRAAVG